MVYTWLQLTLISVNWSTNYPWIKEVWNPRRKNGPINEKYCYQYLLQRYLRSNGIWAHDIFLRECLLTLTYLESSLYNAALYAHSCLSYGAKCTYKVEVDFHEWDQRKSINKIREGKEKLWAWFRTLNDVGRCHFWTSRISTIILFLRLVQTRIILKLYESWVCGLVEFIEITLVLNFLQLSETLWIHLLRRWWKNHHLKIFQ